MQRALLPALRPGSIKASRQSLSVCGAVYRLCACHAVYSLHCYARATVSRPRLAILPTHPRHCFALAPQRLRCPRHRASVSQQSQHRPESFHATLALVHSADCHAHAMRKAEALERPYNNAAAHHLLVNELHLLL